VIDCVILSVLYEFVMCDGLEGVSSEMKSICFLKINLNLFAFRLIFLKFLKFCIYRYDSGL
jgi:hypothetical protein